MKLFSKKKKLSLEFVGFLQAVGVVIYCGLVGLVFWKGETWFGSIAYTYSGPILFLILFAASVLICGLLVFGYPVFLFWDKKQACESLKVIAYTAAWLAIFTVLLFVSLTLA
jgi:hypothetical protein